MNYDELRSLMSRLGWCFIHATDYPDGRRSVTWCRRPAPSTPKPKVLDLLELAGVRTEPHHGHRTITTYY